MRDRSEFTKSQVCEALAGIVDLTEREVQYWTDLGIVEPDISTPPGKGNPRLYSDMNLIDFAVAKQLLDAGVNKKTAAAVMKKIRENKRIRYFTTYLFRQRIVIKNPGTESVEVYFDDPYNDPNADHFKISMRGVLSLIVVDVTDIIDRVSSLFRA